MELERKALVIPMIRRSSLTEKHPGYRLLFHYRADMIDYLPKMVSIDELVDLVPILLVFNALGYKSRTSYPVIWVDVPLMDISSSMVRAF